VHWPHSFSPAGRAGPAFGPYEVVAPIGAGGMGEVYRARDSKLRRDVALKVPLEMDVLFERFYYCRADSLAVCQRGEF
jgi:serine/threonine protein kinase